MAVTPPRKGIYSTFRALPAPLGGFVRQTREGEIYAFDSRGLLAGKVDRYGRRTLYMYLGDGKLFQILYDNGTSMMLGYGSNGLIETFTDPTGRVTRLTHDRERNLTRITDPDNSLRSFEYRADHALISQTDKVNAVKSYAYDMRGNVIHSVRPDQSLIEFQSSNSQLTTTGGLGTTANPFMVSMVGDKRSKFVDGKGQVFRLETNRFGSITKRVDPMGQETLFTRDENNNMTTYRDENGNTTEITYDDMGNILSRINPQGTLTYNYASDPSTYFHQPLSQTDEKGQVTFFEYDSLGNVTRITDPKHHITLLTYINGHLLESERNNGTHTGKFYRYDDNGNMIMAQDLLGQDLFSFTYNSAGNVLSETDALGNTTTLTYNLMNRLLGERDARNGGVSFSYDSEGKLSSRSDAKGNVTSFKNNAVGLVAKKTDPLGRGESFSYDANRNLVQKTDRNGHTITYQYDTLDRLMAKTYPDGSRVSYTYDAAGNRLSVQNSESSLTYVYDNANRVTSVSTAGSSSQPDVTLTYEYDSNGNTTSVMEAVTGRLRRINYEYDRNNNLTKVGHSSSLDPHFVKFRHDSLRRITDVTYPNEIKGLFSYVVGKANQLRSLQYGTSSDPDRISSFTYTYNLNDHITGLETSRGLLTVNSLSYVYDVLNQLTSATEPMGMGMESFTYDMAGNRLRRDGETQDSSFNNNNQLTNDKKFSYTYDKNGNLLTKTNLTTHKVTEYEWDYEDLLIGVIEKESSLVVKMVSYKYDPLGRRIQKNVNGTITKYIYSGSDIFLEFDSGNRFRARYIHGNQFDEPLRMEREVSPYRDESFSEQYFYYHRDRLGNVTEVTNFEGTVVQRYVYDSFGGVTIYDDNGNQITADSGKYLENPFTYTGREYDPETGLYYYRARYYNPETGRFISEDPIGFGGGDLNLYRYVLNNSVNLIDPTGNVVIAIPIILVPSISDIIISAGTATIGFCLNELRKRRERLACAKQRNIEFKQCRRLTDTRDQNRCFENAGEREGQCNQGIPIRFRRPLFP